MYGCDCELWFCTSSSLFSHVQLFLYKSFWIKKKAQTQRKALQLVDRLDQSENYLPKKIQNKFYFLNKKNNQNKKTTKSQKKIIFFLRWLIAIASRTYSLSFLVKTTCLSYRIISSIVLHLTALMYVSNFSFENLEFFRLI